MNVHLLLSEINANREGNAKELSNMRERDLAKLDYVYYHASQRHRLAIGLVAHGRVNKDGPCVRGVLIPAEPASKSGRARHNSSFTRLAGITVTYFLSPFSSFSPNFISYVYRCLALYV